MTPALPRHNRSKFCTAKWAFSNRRSNQFGWNFVRTPCHPAPAHDIGNASDSAPATAKKPAAMRAAGIGYPPISSRNAVSRKGPRVRIPISAKQKESGIYLSLFVWRSCSKKLRARRAGEIYIKRMKTNELNKAKGF